MTTSTLARVPEIAIGTERIAGLGDDVSRLCGREARVLLVADAALGRFGLIYRAAEAIARSGHSVARFEDVSSDVREQQVTAGAEYAREFKADTVVGLGGGSSLDAAKAIAALALAPAELADYRLAARPLPVRKVSLICVPTTAGTGSEVTSTAVLSADDATKFWYWSDSLKPDLVVLDPALSATMPAGLTAATGLDALVHAVEAATTRNATPANDLYALAAIRLAVAALPRAVRMPEDLDARRDMLLAACWAGIAIDNAGTAIAHTVAHALGSLLGLHHGRAAAIGLAATLDWTIEGNPQAFARVAEAFGLGPEPARLPAAMRALLSDVALDLSLPPGLDAAQLARRMATPENAAMRRSTARTADDAALALLAGRVIALAAGRTEAA